MTRGRHVVGRFNARQPRGDRVDRDVVRAQFPRQRAAHADQRALTGNVSQQLGRAPQRRVGRNIDDAAPAAGAQRGQAGRGHQPGAAHIDFHDAVPQRHVQLFGQASAGMGDGCVVHQAVQAAQCAHRVVDAAQAGVGVAQIRQEGIHAQAGAAQAGGLLVQFPAQHVDHRDLRAGLRQIFRKGQAQPASRPGHQDAAARQRERRQGGSVGLRHVRPARLPDLAPELRPALPPAPRPRRAVARCAARA
ncbi:hypothetical protein D3C73_809500 [compost metagenome]